MCLVRLNAITIGHLVRTTNCQVGSIDSSVSAQQSEPRKTFVFSFTEMKQDQHLWYLFLSIWPRLNIFLTFSVSSIDIFQVQSFFHAGVSRGHERGQICILFSFLLTFYATTSASKNKRSARTISLMPFLTSPVLAWMSLPEQLTYARRFTLHCNIKCPLYF